MKRFKHLLLSLCFASLLTAASAHEASDSSKVVRMPWDRPGNQDISLIRKEQKTFDVSPGTAFHLQNKYGEVFLHTWAKNQVKIDITITAYGKTDDLAEKVLDRVSIDYTQISGKVGATTVFDRPSSGLKDLWNSITSQSNIVLNRSRVEIDYEVYLPAGMAIDLDNKFGDVYLEDHGGNVRIQLAHGDMKAGALTGSSGLNFNFSNASIKEVKEANIDIRGGSLNIDKVGMAEFNAALTEVHIKQAQELQILSRNDKFYIGELHHLSGKSYFTKVRIEKLNHGVVLESSYGSMIVQEVAPNFGEIRVTSTSTDLEMRVWQQASFEANITAQTHQLVLPSQMALQSKSLDGKYVNKSGSVGAQAKGTLDINAKGGDVRIFYMDPPKKQ